MGPIRRQCTTSRAIGGLLSLVLALLLVPAGALAQVETGQITGTVSDPLGAAVNEATVTVISRDTGATRTVATTGYGNFTVTNLQPGTYTVKIDAAGFATRTVPVQVTVGTTTTVHVDLPVSAIGESVDVIAGAEGVQVNTENQTLQTVVSETEVRELPTLDRSPYSLVQLSGNVSPTDPSGLGVGYAINGQRAASTNVLLDGADNNNEFTASVGQEVPLDAVQEFSVLTSNFSAEFGRAGGGIVNVATRSGTNDFHGTVYEFNRISALASKSYELNALYPPDGQTENKKGVFTRNQFGYSVGGPVIKDKLLFFQSTEWLRIRSHDAVSVFVPTPELIAASAPATRQFFAGYSTTTPINGRIVTRGELTAWLRNPDPSSPFNALPANLPVFGEIVESVPIDAGGGTPSNQYQVVGRLDYNWTDKTTLYGRYALQSQDFFEGSNWYSPWAGFNTGVTTFNNNVLVSLTNVWSDTFVSQSKFVYNRLNILSPLGDNPVGPTLFLSLSLPTGGAIAMPGYLPFNRAGVLQFGGPQNLAQVYQDQTWTIGDHAVRFGGSYVRILDNRYMGASENAQEGIGPGLIGLNNLVLGQYRSFAVAVDPQGHYPGDEIQTPVAPPQFGRNNRYNEGALYVNDSWKVHPRLTLNLGLRWDYFGVQHNADPSLDSNFYYGPGATIEERVASGRVMLAKDSPVGGLWAKDPNNFGPRLGIAWDVFGDGRTSLRGGYGISYERNFGNVTFNVIQNPPNYAVVTLMNTSGDPIIATNYGPFETGALTVPLPQTQLRHVDENITTAYAHFWSAAVEHQFGDAFVASAEYSGSAGRDLYSISGRNLPFSAIAYNLPWTADAITGVQPSNPLAYSNPRYAFMNTRANGGRSNYNALTLGLDSRLIGSTGLQFQAKYTWSHALDNLSSTFAVGTYNLGFLDPDNPDLDYGSADFDVRHRFVSSGIWNVPFARSTEGVARSLLDGWQITYIFTAHTGSPFTVYDCTFGYYKCIRLLNAGNLRTEGFRNPRETTGESPNSFDYIDLTNQLGQAGTFTGGNPAVTAYAANFCDGAPCGGDYGPWPSNMTGRNTFRSPGNWNLDGGIYKNIDLTERTRLQLRAEIYNVFNHANLFVDTWNVDISGRDTVTAYRSGRRQVQLAVKLIF
jgi:hypothetical protein